MNEPRRPWGLRLLSLTIAVALWLVISVEDREERGQRAVAASVLYNAAPDMVLIDPSEQLRVLLSGPESAIATLDPNQVSVRVDLEQVGIGIHSLSLGASDVTAPPNLRVESITPSQIEVEIDRRSSKELRVEPKFSGEPAAGAVLGQVTVMPSEVVAEGPESRLTELDHVETQPVDLDGHAINFEESAAIASPDSLIQVRPTRVTVRVPLRVSQPTGPAP